MYRAHYKRPTEQSLVTAQRLINAVSTDQLPTELYQGIQTVAGRGQPVRCGTAGLVGPEAVVLTTVTRQDDDEAAGGDDVDVS